MENTVPSLVPLRLVRPVTARAAQPAGAPATASATRFVERVMDGASVRPFTARAVGKSREAALKLSFRASCMTGRYFHSRFPSTPSNL